MYWTIGLWWIILTVLFETGFGMLISDSFAELVKAYDITTGNLWLLCVLFTGTAPWLSTKARKLIQINDMNSREIITLTTTRIRFHFFLTKYGTLFVFY